VRTVPAFPRLLLGKALCRQFKHFRRFCGGKSGQERSSPVTCVALVWHWSGGGLHRRRKGVVGVSPLPSDFRRRSKQVLPQRPAEIPWRGSRGNPSRRSARRRQGNSGRSPDASSAAPDPAEISWARREGSDGLVVQRGNRWNSLPQRCRGGCVTTPITAKRGWPGMCRHSTADARGCPAAIPLTRHDDVTIDAIAVTVAP
jgi:hypothetical protein